MSGGSLSSSTDLSVCGETSRLDESELPPGDSCNVNGLRGSSAREGRELGRVVAAGTAGREDWLGDAARVSCGDRFVVLDWALDPLFQLRLAGASWISELGILIICSCSICPT